MENEKNLNTESQNNNIEEVSEPEKEKMEAHEPEDRPESEKTENVVEKTAVPSSVEPVSERVVPQRPAEPARVPQYTRPESGSVPGHGGPGLNQNQVHGTHSQPDPRGGIRTTYVSNVSQSPAGRPYGAAPVRPTYIPTMTNSAPQKAPKTEKAKVSGGFIAIFIAVCVLVSAISSAGTALLINWVNEKDGGVSNSTVDKNTAEGNESKGELNVNTSNTTVTPAADGSVASAAEIAADTVVEIVTETVTTSFFYGDYVQSGAGSGVIIDSANGYIITCAHVVDGASAVTVTLRDGKEFDAKIIGSDTQTDIAVIQIQPDGTELPQATMGNSDKLVVGEPAIAIGNPLGTLGGTVTSGIISALNREINIDGQDYTLLQTDASINPGNSGGGLFNINGDLIGIVNAKSGGTSESATIEGLGFAIPINSALEVAEQLVDKGYVGGRVNLGIMVNEINNSTTNIDPNLYDYINGTGLYFVGYQDGVEGEFEYGDKILAIDGITVSELSEVRSILNDYSAGDKISVTVSRLNEDGRRRKMINFDVTLIEYVPSETE